MIIAGVSRWGLLVPLILITAVQAATRFKDMQAKSAATNAVGGRPQRGKNPTHVVCHLCAPGTFSTTGYAGMASAACGSCPEGTISLEGATSCTSCVPGKYSSSSSFCTLCPNGTYSDRNGTTICPLYTPASTLRRQGRPALRPAPPAPQVNTDDDVFYLFLQKQKIGAELHIYLEEGTYHKRLFRGPNTNDMKN